MYEGGLWALGHTGHKTHGSDALFSNRAKLGISVAARTKNETNQQSPKRIQRIQSSIVPSSHGVRTNLANTAELCKLVSTIQGFNPCIVETSSCIGGRLL